MRYKGLPTLNITILRIFFVILFALAGVLIFYNYKKNSETALLAAEKLLTEVNEKVLGETHLVFQPVYILGKVVPEMPDVAKKPKDLSHPLLGYLIEALRSSPQISSFYMGYEDGEFYQVISLPEGGGLRSFLNAPADARYAIWHVYQKGDGKRVQAWEFLDNDREVVESRAEKEATYDPRKRPWYKSAMGSDELIKTNLYVFALRKVLGLTFAHRFKGETSGVFGIDITLEAMSRFLQGQKVGETGLVFMFNADGQLTAYPDLSKVIKEEPADDGRSRMVPATVFDLENPVVETVYMKYASGEDLEQEYSSFEVGGETYLLRLTPVPGVYGKEEYIALFASVKDFIGPIAKTRTQSLIFSCIILAVSIPVITLAARSISKSLNALVKESDKIKQFKLDSPVQVKSRVAEIHKLSQSMNTMKTALRTFGRYVPMALVQRLVQSDIVPTLGGERREVTLLFTDVADFTTMSETMAPEDLMLKVSEYFEKLGSVIIEHGGTIDKFIGDAIMAFWNAPVRTDDHCLRACEAALRCVRVSNRLNERWMDQKSRIMFTRFGIHTADAVVGNVGSPDRMNYTAIGASVNMASRLEGLNKFYRTQILVSQSVRDRAEEVFLFRPVDLVIPKGATVPIAVFELIGALPGTAYSDIVVSQKRLDHFANWEKAYANYRNREWERAVAGFTALRKASRGDNLATIYLERARRLLAEDPGDDWTGVEEFKEK